MLEKFFFKKTKKNKTEIQNELAASVKRRSEELSSFINSKVKSAQEEISTIRKKCSNLFETNYQLGLKHLENGNLSEAIFRFRFINKFWPNHLESYYQLAYCLILANKFDKAKKVLDDLITKDEGYKVYAQELLEIVEKSLNSEQNIKQNSQET